MRPLYVLAAALAALLAFLGGVGVATAQPASPSAELQHACAALTADTALALRDVVALSATYAVLPGAALATAARAALGCGDDLPPAGTQIEAAAHACAVLNRDALDRLADELDAPDAVRAYLTDDAIAQARGALGCGDPTVPGEPCTIAGVTGTTAEDGACLIGNPATGGSGDDALPVGGVDTGDGSTA